ncbi:MAG: glucose 1-dehydrogenase [Cyclobacteriaceae bacterium]|nr:glucose 1-dehydrogenase [Cyclobacteriaceae bacterium]
MSQLDLTGKNAIVTGGASGIGKAITLTFANAGAHVIIFELDEASARATVDEVKHAGGNASFIICNIASQEQVIAAINSINLPIHILVNNAGIAHVGNLQTTSASDFDKLFQVNVKGTYNCMQAVIEKMVTQKGGVILNMASIAAMVGLPDRFAYSMTKGAVLSMTYSVARDYVNHNIRCNCISPARIHTPFVDGFITKNYPGKEKEMFEKLSKSQPIGRMGTADEVAQMALYLCSDKATFITGTNFPLDGGFVTLNT